MRPKEKPPIANKFRLVSSYELCRGLTTISWCSEMLLSEHLGRLNAQQKRYLEALHEKSEKLIEFVDIFLYAARIEPQRLVVNFEPVNVVNFVDTILGDFLTQILSKKITIKKIYDRNLPLVNIDSKLARIALQNLFSQIFKYIPVKANIRILIRKQHSNTIIELSYKTLDSSTDRRFKNKLLKMRDAKKESNNPTLGFHFVQSILKQISGRIWFDSSKNKNIILYITFPFLSSNQGAIK